MVIEIIIDGTMEIIGIIEIIGTIETVAETISNVVMTVDRHLDKEGLMEVVVVIEGTIAPNPLHLLMALLKLERARNLIRHQPLL